MCTRFPRPLAKIASLLATEVGIAILDSCTALGPSEGLVSEKKRCVPVTYIKTGTQVGGFRLITTPNSCCQ
jgi:hypothetical protein